MKPNKLLVVKKLDSGNVLTLCVGETLEAWNYQLLEHT